MTQVPISNNPLALKDQGQGPVVVILHGLFGSASNLGHTAKDLATDHRVISVDLPGHGRSAWAEDYSHDAMAQAILDALIPLQLHSFQLIGHSLGGKIGMQLASRLASDWTNIAENKRAVTLEKLIIVDIAPRDYPPHHDAVFEALNAVPLNATISRAEADEIMAQHIPDAGTRAFLLKSFRRNEQGLRTWQFDAKELQAQYAKLALSPTLEHKISCPTLFIKGANSDYLLASDEARITQAFALPEFKIIHGAGHWPHAEKPAAFNSLVRRFLTRAANP